MSKCQCWLTGAEFRECDFRNSLRWFSIAIGWSCRTTFHPGTWNVLQFTTSPRNVVIWDDVEAFRNSFLREISWLLQLQLVYSGLELMTRFHFAVASNLQERRKNYDWIAIQADTKKLKEKTMHPFDDSGGMRWDLNRVNCDRHVFSKNNILVSLSLIQQHSFMMYLPQISQNRDKNVKDRAAVSETEKLNR